MAGAANPFAMALQALERVPAMLVRLLYVSRAVGPQTGTVTAQILGACEAHNAAHGITGVLCQGQGLYLQLLEGQRADINALYLRIAQDRRHRDVQLLGFDEIGQRRYPGWSMAHVLLPDDDAMVRLQHPEFDPYSASGAHMLRLLGELVDGGHRIEAAPAARSR